MQNIKVNRAIAPEIKIPETINITQTEKYTLQNGKEIYIFPEKSAKLIRLEIIFEAGQINAENPTLAKTTSYMIDEGSKKFSSQETSELIDFYGAELYLNATKHNTAIKLTVLKKHFPKLIDLLFETIENPIFPQKEFKLVTQNRYQNFLIESEKTSFKASQKFMQALFGENNIYGRITKPEHFTQLTTQDLKDFHKKHYLLGKALITLSGNIDNQILSLLDKKLNKFTPQKPRTYKNYDIETQPSTEKQHIIHKEEAMQSSIMMGLTTIKKTHPDFIPLSIANTILGGYFGSRLMTNIREDKGYTYGIYSSLIPLYGTSIFYISADTKQEATTQTISEINKEIAKLQTKPIPLDELKTVKHYIIGNLLKHFDGAIAKARIFKSLYPYELNENWYIKYINILQNISPEEIQNTLNKYIHPDKLYTVIATNKLKMK